ncbi:MGH1-like glycoside hydrolase domain-containing protein [Flaviaesturariibacter flavus]|uniref:MGH1-like glycoside hydrolase domain-containing protein n=1 Tax=Flaviaesturariibacter flavus TaxID=2502780 RepID=UPI001FB4F80E|nr:glucosidase [Flaviaesturariibacter flavus]
MSNAVPNPAEYNHPFWGPYLSERQWGTVREDYSPDGNAWEYFPFEQSHYRAYLWGEDGLAGISDRLGLLCFGVALWNGKDPILKERLYGLHNYEGNHGEDVKELYYYLDNVPDHSYMEFLYQYPQAEFPYAQLKTENAARGRREPEYELLDTGLFDNDRYFDVQVTYARGEGDEVFVRIDVCNRAPRAADITVLPTLWFSQLAHGKAQTPVITAQGAGAARAFHERIGPWYFYCAPGAELLFTDNRSNLARLRGETDSELFTKDAFHDAVISGETRLLRERGTGTKMGALHRLRVPARGTQSVFIRISATELDHPFPDGFTEVFAARKQAADAWYEGLLPAGTRADLRNIYRQAIAGLLWSKQFYNFDVEKWLQRSDGVTPLAPQRAQGRNHDWQHLKNKDIIAMPDKWEYPWYAAWDLAFQCIAFAAVDAAFAKQQLLLIMREWYMKPDGQLPAYEWNFSDVNPPVHAWAAMEVYRIEKVQKGTGDILFLKKIFQKLLINFTWWTNRKDRNGNNIFEGGFLGLDNIGVFNRSFYGEHMRLEQADGTSWMGTYALSMMDMALEIALHDPSFEDTATRFFEHFVLIAESLNEHHLWNKEDRFFYDVLSIPGQEPMPLRIKSIVGLTSLFAVSTIGRHKLEALPDFCRRTEWFERYRRKYNKFWPNEERGDQQEILLSLVKKERLVYLLERLLDEAEFLSPGGIRALSKDHEQHPYSVSIDGTEYSIAYDPGDSTSDIFGGNSNWRGPVWIPINYLLIKSLRRYGRFYGDSLQVEYPAGSGTRMNLCAVADALTGRVISLFARNADDERPAYGSYNAFYQKPSNRQLLLFYEYFHGDSGCGLGASHQTGWTALVAELIKEAAGTASGAAAAGYAINPEGQLT